MNYINHMKHITLPDGWSIESEDASTVVIKATKGYSNVFVTVDLKMRVYRGGLVTTGRPLSPKSYGGRGWREELIDDAITWLKGISK